MFTGIRTVTCKNVGISNIFDSQFVLFPCYPLSADRVVRAIDGFPTNQLLVKHGIMGDSLLINFIM